MQLISCSQVSSCSKQGITLGNTTWFTEMNTSLDCPVCFERFNLNKGKRPMSLPCGHTYCSNCTLTVVRLICPVCQVPFASAVSNHLLLREIMDAAAAVSLREAPQVCSSQGYAVRTPSLSITWASFWGKWHRVFVSTVSLCSSISLWCWLTPFPDVKPCF